MTKLNQVFLFSGLSWIAFALVSDPAFSNPLTIKKLPDLAILQQNYNQGTAPSESDLESLNYGACYINETAFLTVSYGSRNAQGEFVQAGATIDYNDDVIHNDVTISEGAKKIGVMIAKGNWLYYSPVTISSNEMVSQYNGAPMEYLRTYQGQLYSHTYYKSGRRVFDFYCYYSVKE
jgi:hypothetical protein